MTTTTTTTTTRILIIISAKTLAHGEGKDLLENLADNLKN